MDTVVVRQVAKRYGVTSVLRGVSFALPPGTVTVLQGDNGSGKTTLMRVVAGLVKPTSGEVNYGFGQGRRNNPVRAMIGLVGHEPMVYPDLTGKENLLLFAQLYGIKEPTTRAWGLAQRFLLLECWERRARTYSRGQLQRLSLAKALLAQPQLLLLDEPSAALDQTANEILCQAIREERQRGCTTLLITHEAARFRSVATHLLHLRLGRIVD